MAVPDAGTVSQVQLSQERQQQEGQAACVAAQLYLLYLMFVTLANMPKGLVAAQPMNLVFVALAKMP